ncbi:unnamed protein product [Brassica napus]|uniref:(rape) hypothetical protein n=1 Tax=Brassica napus TaxID=3708 RepID=A0A817ASW0_BRANA|nr:unnamed protein product [Brassica napus]
MAGLPHAPVDQATGQASSNHPNNNVITYSNLHFFVNISNSNL